MNETDIFLEKIIKDWFKFTDFNPDANNEHYEGNMLTWNYNNWDLSKKIFKLVKEYSSSILALIMLRTSAEEYFTKECWSINAKKA